MDLAITESRPPILKDESGSFRIGDTRVTLYTVIKAFQLGATCEEVVYQFPTLKLADVYAVISYYLQNLESVDQYMADYEKNAADLKLEVEKNIDSSTIRSRLLKRRNSASQK